MNFVCISFNYEVVSIEIFLHYNTPALGVSLLVFVLVCEIYPPTLFADGVDAAVDTGILELA